ncbi:MAG: winged helix-turn-helix domain-containing protein [Ilumatobacter sp.]|uniref:ArsR/SmtB family transcription factor n=1 Tax=Ilumatobacter sp. TaxID=1967498 RepID=UPI003C78FDE1
MSTSPGEYDLATALERLEAVEARVAKLEAEHARSEADAAPTADSLSAEVEGQPERFWALLGLQERLDDSGGVLFTGAVTTPVGERYLWQQAVTTEEVLDVDWADQAQALSALGHPVRLQILQYVLLGVRTTAELAEIAEVNTTGQLHHHLKDLVAARWLRSPGRGRYEIPVDRVISLLTIVEATRVGA